MQLSHKQNFKKKIQIHSLHGEYVKVTEDSFPVVFISRGQVSVIHTKTQVK